MAILNKKYKKTEMEALENEKGCGLYFSKETNKFFGTTKTLCYKHSLFIQDRDNFEATKKIYDVKLFVNQEDRVNFWTLGCALDTLADAKILVKQLQRVFEKGLGFREKETLENLTSVYTRGDGVIEFISDKNKDNPSYSFEILLRGGEFEVIG